MRILHVVSRSQRRGAEIVAVELAALLDRRGAENRVVALAPGFDGGTVPGLPALTDRRAGGTIALLVAARALRRDLRTHPADVVLAHGGRALEAVVLTGRRRPLVVWQRVLGFPASVWRLPRRWWWTRVVRRTDAVACISEELGAEVRRLGFAGPVWSIPNSRDPERFATVDRRVARRTLCDRLGIDDRAPLIGWIGHLTAQKRPDRAVAVLAAVRAVHPEARLVVAGDGPWRARVEAAVADAQLGGAVHLLGPVDDVVPVLGGVDVFLLTSDDEGVPGVLIEALMTGCAVVSGPVGAVPDMIDDDRTGRLAADTSVTAAAELVIDLLADPARARALGDSARANAIVRWSSSVIADEYAGQLAALVRLADD
ncbi:MAG: glycosyltransferase family 4 protein [Actinomycetota bacterium]